MMDCKCLTVFLFGLHKISYLCILLTLSSSNLFDYFNNNKKWVVHLVLERKRLTVTSANWERFFAKYLECVGVGWRAELALVITEKEPEEVRGQFLFRALSSYVFIVIEVHHRCQVCLNQPLQLLPFPTQRRVKVRKVYSHFLLLWVTTV